MKKKALIPLLLILFQMASIAQNSVFNYIDISGNLPSDIRPCLLYTSDAADE